MNTVTTVNAHDAAAQFSQLLESVEQGEEVVIAREGVPVARIVPVPPQPSERTPGNLKGKIWMSEDFDAPLPDDVLDEFYR